MTTPAPSPAEALAAVRVEACEVAGFDPSSPEGAAVMEGVTFTWHRFRLWALPEVRGMVVTSLEQTPEGT
jgi:hypothetical protein